MQVFEKAPDPAVCQLHKGVAKRRKVGAQKGDTRMLMHLYPVAAIGYSLVWLLAGGGLGGAIIIFLVAKMLGR